MTSKYKYPNIEAERVRHNMSQDDLSRKLGTGSKTSYYWRDTGNIPVPALMSLAEMFDCSVDYLLGKTRNPTPYPKA